MNWTDFVAVNVRIEYADTAKMNKIRAWARKNGAAVNVERYARDAYSGTVKIPSPWNEGKSVQEAKAAAVRAIIHA